MTSLKADLGEYLREQRHSARLSLRQLADLAGVSNPYLSQIERGLKKPSAEILQQLAKGLRISAESLYVRAGILDEQDDRQLETKAAILADPLLAERQKRVLLDIYDAFCAENLRATAGTDASTAAAGDTHAATDAASGPDDGDTRSAAEPLASGRRARGRRARAGSRSSDAGLADSSTDDAGPGDEIGSHSGSTDPNLPGPGPAHRTPDDQATGAPSPDVSSPDTSETHRTTGDATTGSPRAPRTARTTRTTTPKGSS